MSNISSYENKQEDIKNLKTPQIESFKNIYEGTDYKIHFVIKEFTAVCPKTGLPDFGEIEITYKPDALCVELKSLKYYMLFYRDLGIFHENVVNKITDDFVAAIKPTYLKVKGDYNLRGGIQTIVEREYYKP